MEDDLNFLAKLKTTSNFNGNRRRPNFFGKMEDDLNLRVMEDDLNVRGNGRQPQFLGKLRTTSMNDETNGLK